MPVRATATRALLLSLCALCSLFTIGCALERGGLASGDSWPDTSTIAFVPAEFFTNSSNTALSGPQQVPVSSAERAAIARALEDLPKFPPNPFSGCHARAHITYRALNAASNQKAFKVWLFSGRALSPALGGSIQFTSPSKAVTSWDYHVAAAFVDEQGEVLVVDSLASSRPLSVKDWVRAFEIKGVALLTHLPGELYLFNRTEVPAVDPQIPGGLRQHQMSRNVLNGVFYGYEGNAAQTHDGASDLAADALSMALTQEEFAQCPWKNQATDSLQLKSLAAASPPPEECGAAAALYAREFERWRLMGL